MNNKRSMRDDPDAEDENIEKVARRGDEDNFAPIGTREPLTPVNHSTRFGT
jgi:hypothetical protein